ncbi:MAG: integrase zinc binding domain-containing protein, partial [Actinomycetota bacterium]|nr:integrase zinc binding domain-containing protein [Actinomycetota bacterium]
MYADDRIYVPRRGRYALIQAAHAAAHQGFGSTRGLLEKSFYWPYMSHDARRYVDACRAARAVRPRPGQENRPELFPAAPPSPTIVMDPVARTIRTVPDWDGPRGAEKIQVELRRIPTPEKPDPLAGVREAVHQATGPSSFVRTVKSVPDWDGPRGAEKIQVELTRPDTLEANLGLSPAVENKTPVTPREDLATDENLDSPLPSHSCLKQSPDRPGLPPAGESRLVPGRPPVVCHSCQLTGHKKSQCANEAPKTADAPASRRRRRRNRDLATIFGPRAMRFIEQQGAAQSLPVPQVELTPQLDAEGDVSNDQNCVSPHQSGS